MTRSIKVFYDETFDKKLHIRRNRCILKKNFRKGRQCDLIETPETWEQIMFGKILIYLIFFHPLKPVQICPLFMIPTYLHFFFG